MEYSNVVYIIIVIIVLYYFITWYLADSTEMVAIHGTGETLSIAAAKGGKSSHINCAYSIWININEYKTSERNIFDRKDIKMKLDIDNNLCLDVNTGSATLTPAIINTDKLSLPMQKWVNIIISFESQYLTVYIDGKMVASKEVKGWTAAESETTIGGDKSFSGEIANFKYYNDYLTVREAWEIYRDGYGSGFLSGLLNKYKLKVAFLEDNSEVTSFEF